jgi:hypothetical protein
VHNPIGVGTADERSPAADDATDLMNDFMSIVYSFAARMYGQRSAGRRTQQVTDALSSDSQTPETTEHISTDAE